MISILNLPYTPTNVTETTNFGNQFSIYKNATQNESYFKTSQIFDSNFKFEFENTNFTNSTIGMSTDNYTEYAEIPYYIKVTSMTFCIVIMCLGVIGNVMVPIVILKTKDMRNSTNIFLVNLSIADLMVLLVCTPTVLVEVNSKPETWVLGKELCLAVPFVELTVAHASVLTILAISFERYYAICEPLRAGYVCTKTRATLICALAWFFAALFTSPILAIAEHHTMMQRDGTTYTQCLTQAITIWQITFFLTTILLLYVLPLIILVVLYTIIAKNLISAASKVVMNKTIDPCNTRARKQVILMLATVVLCFFLCLMPYRVLALWIIFTPTELSEDVNPEKWYNWLYFSRVMLYINSAINPILYNMMSSKFRIGFCKVWICYRTVDKSQRRQNTVMTNGSTTSSSLTRTTNSLKKLFQRNSIDDAEAENKDENKTKNCHKTKQNNKNFLRQHSAPDHTNVKPTIKRIKSEGDTLEDADIKMKIIDLDENNLFDYKCKDENVNECQRSRNYSLRRSVLVNSAKAKSVECEPNKKFYQKVKVECVLGLKKSKSVDCEFPESFV